MATVSSKQQRGCRFSFLEMFDIKQNITSFLLFLTLTRLSIPNLMMFFYRLIFVYMYKILYLTSCGITVFIERRWIKTHYFNWRDHCCPIHLSIFKVNKGRQTSKITFVGTYAGLSAHKMWLITSDKGNSRGPLRLSTKCVLSQRFSFIIWKLDVFDVL